MTSPPKNLPEDSFTGPELAMGAGITARNLALPFERGALDDNDRKPNAARVFDERMACILFGVGALHGTGVELLLAAKISNCIIRQFMMGEPKQAEALIWIANLPPKLKEETSVYRALAEATGMPGFMSGAGTCGDHLIEIADRQYVLSTRNIEGWTTESPFDGNPLPSSPLAKIMNWQRGMDAVVKYVGHDIEYELDVEHEFLRARENAVGIIRLNISLAIRNGFFRILKHRTTP
ncbi:MAG: hypothetical protein HQL37_10415 [Alphaproteobacteria bacterium]|nr:hypothetical protein [Alphaproteobacteria bacterium]